MLNVRVRVHYPGHGVGNHKMGVILESHVLPAAVGDGVQAYVVVGFDDGTYEAVQLSRCTRAAAGY